MMSKRKVGIVILNYNGSSYLRYALEALLAAKTKVPFAAGVIDNGSEKKDADQAKRYFQQYLNRGGQGFFIRSEKNLGFSGGNNVVMKRFLDDPDITHFCMLNSDVLVTDHWLEYLTDHDYDVTGPVTNATGNEQTVAVDYDVKLNHDAFSVVNQFAAYRHQVYGDSAFESDILYFFNTIFARRVVEKVGLLDERFYPGSYEDVDYCWRIKQAGFKQMIMRGCYVHHFGSGSFSKLDMPKRVEISNVNRKRLEEKWNIKWENDYWRMLQSCRQDMDRFQDRPMDARSSALIAKAIQSAEELIKNWSSGIEWYQSEQYEKTILEKYAALPTNTVDDIQPVEPVAYIKKKYLQLEDLCGKRLLYLAWKKVEAKPFARIQPEVYDVLVNKSYQFDGMACPTLPLKELSGKKMLKQAARLLAEKIGFPTQKPLTIHVETSPDPVTNDQPLLDELREKLTSSSKRVAIHAPMFNKENERDGYIQRIQRIDEEIFDGYFRVYFLEDGKRNDQISIQKVDEQHFFVCYNSHQAKQREMVFQWTEMCGLLYIHSINRFMTDSVSADMCQLLNLTNVRTVWDVHGSVPEEYAMYGSDLGKKLGDEVESFIYHHIDVIVVVNEAMKRHLLKKHGNTNAVFVVLPIFNIDLHKHDLRQDDSAADRRPVIVYAGGVQKWQNIELMQQIMEKTADRYDYRVFVPTPDEFNATWPTQKPDNVLVGSCSPDELANEYLSCDYGFVLRDDSVVNYVACPTKMIEYIRFGIVPILKSKQIGDFVELGMQYVDYQRCMNGQMPDEATRREMACQNEAILERLHKTYVDGIASLKHTIAQPETVASTLPPAIGLVVTTFERGGLEQIVLYLYQGYKRAGYRVYLLCQKNILGSMAEQIDDGELLVFHDSEKLLFSLLKNYNIKLLHYHYNVFALEKMREHGVKTIYTMHNTYIWKDDREIQEYASVLKLADYVVPVSTAVENYFNARTNSICQNMRTIYNGISFAELSLRNLPATLTRQGLNLGKDDVTLAFIASFYPAKGQTGMIGVMEEVVKSHPNVKLLLVGNIGNAEFYQNFREKLEASPAKDSIIQVDYFPHKYIGEFLRQTVDIFVLPTLQEGCSNAVLEAIYCDKPMVLTDVGNARQAEAEASCIVAPTPYPDIVKLQNSTLYEVSLMKDMPNKKAVTDAIVHMVDHLPDYQQKAKLSDEKKNMFSVETMVNAYLKLIRLTEKQ